MSWDWEKTLSDITTPVGSLLQNEVAIRDAKQAQSLTAKSIPTIVVPIAILVFIYLIIKKKL